MEKIVIANREHTPARHEEHGAYTFDKHLIVPKRAENRCTVAIMEVPPHKAAFPYHYHMNITEVFYIISGCGRLETPDGEKTVAAGDVLVFPCGESGAHRLWNTSDTEPLVYLDCDTTAAADVAFYPHSGKAGLLLEGQPGTFFPLSGAVNYYQNDPDA
ncbi:cupin domain-containing protein [Ethanoligenens harbinense]|uniref:Cupin 2 conserved barrel domain protein n=1 Tax=Ethanoligenens harbinense (strain DSM 18485 / JCM 12961 / CGMCC 1.5033 / YUAN-3) TaxID=663278 RepID=E6U5H1_ETHHY|nr:cupin domain-containing protein [Ethanoligenens harbinense]ADU25638.1 Cupin 2 conserved barrel domain protein [Ethanoligenens harbinense YUAN-3]